MNRKHLLWHVFQYMEACDMDISDMIEACSYNKTMFSDNPQQGEITVAQAMQERYSAYKKSLHND